MSVVFASPTYQPIAPNVHLGQIAAVMFAANRGVKWAGIPEIHGVKLSTIDSVRNRIVREAIKLGETEHIDGIVWVDSDVRPKVDGLYRLIEHGKDFVTGMYRQKADDGAPVVGVLDPLHRDGKGGIRWLEHWEPNMVYPVDGCGFGCVYTSLNMLRIMGEPWFSFGDWSEDFSFCMKAKAAGYQLYVDTAVTCAHIGEPQEWTIEDFQARRAFADSAA